MSINCNMTVKGASGCSWQASFDIIWHVACHECGDYCQWVTNEECVISWVYNNYIENNAFHLYDWTFNCSILYLVELWQIRNSNKILNIYSFRKEHKCVEHIEIRFVLYTLINLLTFFISTARLFRWLGEKNPDLFLNNLISSWTY